MYFTRKFKMHFKITHKLFPVVAFVLYRILPSTATEILALGNPDHWPHQHVNQSRCSCGEHSRPRSFKSNTSFCCIHTNELNTAQTFTSTVDVIFMVPLNYTKRTPLRTTIFATFALALSK